MAFVTSAVNFGLHLFLARGTRNIRAALLIQVHDLLVASVHMLAVLVAGTETLVAERALPVGSTSTPPLVQ